MQGPHQRWHFHTEHFLANTAFLRKTFVLARLETAISTQISTQSARVCIGVCLCLFNVCVTNDIGAMGILTLPSRTGVTLHVRACGQAEHSALCNFTTGAGGWWDRIDSGLFDRNSVIGPETQDRNMMSEIWHFAVSHLRCVFIFQFSALSTLRRRLRQTAHWKW